MAFTAAGKLDDAQRALERALERDPTNQMAAFAKQQLEAAKQR